VAFGLSGLVQVNDAVGGGIGWNCDGTPASAGVGTWFLGDNGLNAKFLIPGDKTTAGGKVWRVKATLTTNQTTHGAAPGYRLIAQMYKNVHNSGISVFSIGDEGAIDNPVSGSPLVATIVWAVPYTLQGLDDGEKMDLANFGTDPAAGSDNRNYTIMFDGVDLSGDAGTLVMDSCVIDSYARPADKATADYAWGGATGTAFNNATDGYKAAATGSNFGLANLTYGTYAITATDVTLTMGTIATGGIKYQKTYLDPPSLSAGAKTALAEAADSLNRFRVHCTSPNPDLCPIVRWQTVPIADASGFPTDNTTFFEVLGNVGDITAALLPAGGYIGVPRATTGSWVDCYVFTHRTTGARFMHFNWDAYYAQAFATNGWTAASGAIGVNEIVLNKALANP